MGVTALRVPERDGVLVRREHSRIPLLIWKCHPDAEAAAAIARKARDRAIKVSSPRGNGLVSDHLLSSVNAMPMHYWQPSPLHGSRQETGGTAWKIIDCGVARTSCGESKRRQILKDEGRLLQQAHRLTEPPRVF